MGIRISLAEVMEHAGTRTGAVTPSSARCGVCQTQHALITRSPYHISCRHCGFNGDAVEYYAAVKSVPTLAGLEELEELGAVGTDPNYRADIPSRQKGLSLIHAGREYLNSSASAISAILQSHNIDWGRDITSSAQSWLVALTAEILEIAEIAIEKSMRGVMKWWGRWAALGIPDWGDDGLHGIWLIRGADAEGGCCRYLRLIPGTHKGIAGENAVGLEHREVGITDNPLIALRLNLRQLVDGPLAYPLLVQTPGGPLLHRLGAVQPVFMPSDAPLTTAVTAAGVFGAEVIHGDIGWNPQKRPWPKGMSTPGMIRRLKGLTISPHLAVGRELLAMPQDRARALTAGVHLPRPHIHQILGMFDGEDAATLQGLFESAATPAAVDIDGKLVTESAQGWFIGPRQITNFTFTVDSISTDPLKSASTAEGAISFGSDRLGFAVDFNRLTTHTAAVLRGIILSHNGFGIPEIASGWGAKLLRIAAAFKTPERGVVTAAMGWRDAATLCLPRFSVGASGIFMTESVIPGPQLAAPINPPVMEWEAFEDREFCITALALLINLIRTRAGMPGYGLLVPVQDLVDRIAAMLGVGVKSALTPEEVKDAYTSPLPLPVSWSERGFTEFVQTFGPAHVLAAVPRGTFRLMRLHQGWVCLDILDCPQASALRLIFPLLSEIWADIPNPSAPGWIHDLGDLVDTAVTARGVKRVGLRAAARDIEATAYSHPGNAGGLVIGHFWWAVDQGILKPTYTKDLVVFSKSQIRTALALPGAPITDLKHIETVLLRANLLMQNDKKTWGIHEPMWKSYGALIAMR